MQVYFARSALRHGISDERARYVIEHCPSPIFGFDPSGADVALFLGPDRYGVPLEVLALSKGDHELLVIHAMPLRHLYLSAYREVMRWHER